MKTWLDQNWNTFACSLLVHALQKMGVTAYFVSPGYRDAPFIAAIQAMPNLYVRSCWDERAGAFEALGYAKATRKPVVLLCTSGTAGANYLPALIEAKTDHVPLLVITADRPFELVHAAAQQVTDQRHYFGSFVKKSLDFPAPSASLDPAAWISYVRMLIDLSLDGRPGPVHINLPFRTPLDPVEAQDRPQPDFMERSKELVRSLLPSPSGGIVQGLTPQARREWIDSMRGAERGLIILGRIRGRDEQRAAAALAESLGWPCYADISSGMKGRLESEIGDPQHPIMSAALEAYRPDVCLHLGRRPVTSFFDSFLPKIQVQSYWVVTSEEAVQDPGHLPQRRQLALDIRSLYEAWQHTPFVQSVAHENLWKATDAYRQKLQTTPIAGFCFADVARAIADTLPTRDHGLFLGNSTAIRAFDSWCDLRGRRLSWVEANRGVSGIEGLVATTLGLAAGSLHAWTVVLGDVSMIHDLNSILSLPQSQSPLIVVLVNNGGGRIFETLPIHAHEWVKDPLISTPHSFRFEGLAQMAGLDYRLCETRESFSQAYRKALDAGRSCIIECVQEPLADQAFSVALKQQES